MTRYANGKIFRGRTASTEDRRTAPSRIGTLVPDVERGPIDSV